MFSAALKGFGLLLLVTSFPAVAQQQSFPLNKNPFQQPDILSYKPPVAPIAVPEVEVSEPVDLDPPEVELKAVILSQSEPMVLIDESFLKIGDQYEEMRLIAIVENRAIFRFYGKNYTYTISDEPLGTGR